MCMRHGMQVAIINPFIKIQETVNKMHGLITEIRNQNLGGAAQDGAAPDGDDALVNEPSDVNFGDSPVARI